MKRILVLFIAICLTVCCFAACDNTTDNNNDNDNSNSSTVEFPEYVSDKSVSTEGSYYDPKNTGAGVEIDMNKIKSEINAYDYDDFARTDDVTDFIVIRVKNYGDIVVAVRSDIAPKTAANFKKLVSEDFYTDLIFHRVVKGFMVQAGGIYKDGTEKHANSIVGEFAINGFENNLEHVKGVISMARTSVMNSASSQFFLMHEHSPHLDAQYAGFGYVLAGLDVVDAIANCKVNNPSSSSPSPVDPIIIMEAFFVKPIEGTGIASETEYKPCEHTFGEWEDETPATCTKTGTQKRACTQCEKTQTQTSPIIAHQYEGSFCVMCNDYNFEANLSTEGGILNTGSTGTGESINMEAVSSQIGAYKAEDFVKSENMTDFVAIKVKGYGNIVIALRGDVAPITVENFKKLVSEDFYNDIIFHRVVENFMIQGGYKTSDGESKTADKIVGEFELNGHKNNLSHISGVISMARASSYDSASSQIFIMHAAYESLNGNYAGFGYVLAGLDVVDAIATCKVDNPAASSPRPIEDVVIEEMFFVEPVVGTGLGITE